MTHHQYNNLSLPHITVKVDILQYFIYILQWKHHQLCWCWIQYVYSICTYCTWLHIIYTPCRLEALITTEVPFPIHLNFHVTITLRMFHFFSNKSFHEHHIPDVQYWHFIMKIRLNLQLIFLSWYLNTRKHLDSILLFLYWKRKINFDKMKFSYV